MLGPTHLPVVSWVLCFLFFFLLCFYLVDVDDDDDDWGLLLLQSYARAGKTAQATQSIFVHLHAYVSCTCIVDQNTCVGYVFFLREREKNNASCAVDENKILVSMFV